MKQLSQEKNQKADQAAKEMSVEAAFAEVEKRMSLLEKDDIELEESFRLYKEGMELLKHCDESIDKVEKKVREIAADGTLKDFG